MGSAMRRRRHSAWRSDAYVPAKTVDLGKARARQGLIFAGCSLACFAVGLAAAGLAGRHHPWIIAFVVPILLAGAILGAVSRSPELVIRALKPRGQHRGSSNDSDPA